MLVLRASLASPFVRKVRIAAALLGLQDRIDIAVADTSNAEDSLRSQNPLGKVPALILENGETIFDSAVIVEYLDWLGGGRIIPSDPKLRFRSLTQESLADGIADAGVLLRYETVWREPKMRSEKWIAYQSDKIVRALRAFDAGAAGPFQRHRRDRPRLRARLPRPALRRRLARPPPPPRRVARRFAKATPSFEATRFSG